MRLFVSIARTIGLCEYAIRVGAVAEVVAIGCWGAGEVAAVMVKLLWTSIQKMVILCGWQIFYESVRGPFVKALPHGVGSGSDFAVAKPREKNLALEEATRFLSTLRPSLQPLNRTQMTVS